MNYVKHNYCNIHILRQKKREINRWVLKIPKNILSVLNNSTLSVAAYYNASLWPHPLESLCKRIRESSLGSLFELLSLLDSVSNGKAYTVQRRISSVCERGTWNERMK